MRQRYRPAICVHLGSVEVPQFEPHRPVAKIRCVHECGKETDRTSLEGARRPELLGKTLIYTVAYLREIFEQPGELEPIHQRFPWARQVQSPKASPQGGQYIGRHRKVVRF